MFPLTWEIQRLLDLKILSQCPKTPRTFTVTCTPWQFFHALTGEWRSVKQVYKLLEGEWMSFIIALYSSSGAHENVYCVRQVTSGQDKKFMRHCAVNQLNTPAEQGGFPYLLKSVATFAVNLTSSSKDGTKLLSYQQMSETIRRLSDDFQFS